MEAFTSRCWEPSYKTDDHAGKEGSVEAAAGGTSGDGNDNDDDDGATPEVSAAPAKHEAASDTKSQS